MREIAGAIIILAGSVFGAAGFLAPVSLAPGAWIIGIVFGIAGYRVFVRDKPSAEKPDESATPS